MELGILAAVVVAAVVAYFVFGRKKDQAPETVVVQPTDPVANVDLTPPPAPVNSEFTEAELMKKTKAELIKLAAERGLTLKSSDTKPNLVIQIMMGREGAHLL